MTAEEAAKLWLYAHGYRYDDENINSLARLLKDQDRITRNACADAVRNLDACTPFSAVKAIMNTKAV
jgi:hypothetical protein